MNLRELNSLFLVGVRDLDRLETLRSFLKDYPVGGFVFFNAPIDTDSYVWGDPNEACEKLYELGELAREHKAFLCVDQEGGRVQRLKEPFSKIPAQAIQGKAFESGFDSSSFFEFYSVIARQLQLAGISLNFAPVLDLAYEDSNSTVIGDRAYSSRIDTVSQLGRLYCEAFEAIGVGTTLKHYPGHGSSLEDSHEQIAQLQKSYEELKHLDVRAFELVAPSATAIMPGHLSLPDSEEILSLYADWLEKERKRLPSHLLWITDDLILMKAVSGLTPWKRCIDLKYDFISLCGDFDQAAQAIDDSIRHVEENYSDFSDEQELELRCRHAREIFWPRESPAPFKVWKKELMELGQQGNDWGEKIESFGEA